LLSVLQLGLLFIRIFSLSIDGSLEVSHRIIIVLLGSVSLLLEEFEFALPESEFPIIGIGEVLILTIQLRILALLLLQLLLDVGLVAVQSESQLLVRVLQPQDLSVVGLRGLAQLGVQGVALLSQHGSLAIVLRGHTGKCSLDVLQGLAFHVVFGLYRFFFGCHSCNLVL